MRFKTRFFSNTSEVTLIERLRNGLHWYWPGQLSLLEWLWFLAALIMACGYSLSGGVSFAKLGIPLPSSSENTPIGQVKIFVSELFLFFCFLVAFLKQRTRVFNRFAQLLKSGWIFCILFFLLLYGLVRLIPDFSKMPIMVIRNSAFVWYLLIPLAIALIDLPKGALESVFKVALSVAVLRFVYSLLFIAYFNQYPMPEWSQDVGIYILIFAGFSEGKNGRRLWPLLLIGAGLGINYYTKYQRTSLIGIILSVGACCWIYRKSWRRVLSNLGVLLFTALFFMQFWGVYRKVYDIAFDKYIELRFHKGAKNLSDEEAKEMIAKGFDVEEIEEMQDVEVPCPDIGDSKTRQMRSVKKDDPCDELTSGPTKTVRQLVKRRQVRRKKLESDRADEVSNPFRKSQADVNGLEIFRWQMWSDAIVEIKEHPVFGIGFLRQVVYRVFMGGNLYIPNSGGFENSARSPIAGPHNSYLNAVTRLGIFGSLFLVLHIGCLWVLYRKQYFFAAMGLFAQMLYASFNVGLEGPVRSFLLLLAIGAALTAILSEKKSGVN